MQVLRRSFKVLQVIGVWRPSEWCGWKKWLYNIYTTIVIIIPYSIILTQLLELPTYIDNFETYIHNSLILLTQINACAKVTNICRKKNEIRKAFRILMTRKCLTQDNNEKEIQVRFENMDKWNLLIYGGITEFTVIVFAMSSIFKDTPERKFIFNSWLPFRTESEVLYWVVYIYQLAAVIITSCINLSYEILVAGCMMQASAQLDILKYRMRRLSEIKMNYSQHYDISSMNTTGEVEYLIEKHIISDYIEHHLEIFKFAKSTNKIFSYTIFLQYSISAIVICNSAYRLSRLGPFTPEFLALIGYLMCMLMQIFILCFYGNALICKSANVRNEIYSMDWLALNVSSRKSLLVMMLRTMKPIKFTVGPIVVLSLKSFRKIINFSYSVYNVLQHLS